MDTELQNSMKPHIGTCVYILAESYEQLMLRKIPKEIAIRFSMQILSLIMGNARGEDKKETSTDLATLMAMLSPGGNA